MCGICGIINFIGEPVRSELIQGMMDIMKHRGPDDEGMFIDGNVGLGHVRLSILDLSPAGHQPMFSHDKRYVIVYNGEVYNYIELREQLQKRGHTFHTATDTEVVLAAFQEWGEDCQSHFNGMWALSIYDQQKRTIFGSRDRYGIKPLYYLKTGAFFAFASEIPPLLTLLSGKPSPDYQSIFDYLVFNRTDQTERTFFDEIKKIQHGHTFKIDHAGFEIRKWYSLEDRIAQSTGFKSPEAFKDLFSSSIALRLRSDVPVGVCLSGGLDSSSIVSVLLQDYDKSDLFTFSAVYQKGQHGDESEFIYAYRKQLENMRFTTPTAETLEQDLQTFVKAHAEPMASTSPYAQFKVMELAKENVVVTLDGQGADEELAGYHYFFGFFFKDLLKRGRIDKLCLEILYYLYLHKSFFGIKSFLYFLLPKKLRTRARVSEKGYINPEFCKEYQDGNAIADQLYGSNSVQQALINHFEFKLEHLLKWEDRNSMWHSLEARVPFLDYRFVENILASSGDVMFKNGMTKHILRQAMHGLLPEAIRLRRDKIGFGTPQDEWFRTARWNRIVTDILSSHSFKQRKLIEPHHAMNKYRQHKSEVINASKEIWKWVHLEMWFREFVD